MTLLLQESSCNTKKILHPWQKTIKNVHINTFKTAHNSVNNSQYPNKKDKVPDENRVKFTIIGDRITKEFIHCVKLLEGLYKYRSKTFDAPTVRGVTSVEWPKIWNDLKLEYGGLAYCVQSPVAVMINDKFLGGVKELQEILESRYDYHLTLDYYKEGAGNFINFVRSSGRTCAYMHISIDCESTGTLIFMLYTDLVPYTCENFLRLCQSKRGGYSGTPVHRIVKDGWIQCGGFGLKSSDLDCENFMIPHDRRGVLCMANDGRHVDCSTQFFVLLQPAPWMAHKYVAFGQLIDGESTLKAIECVPTFYESPTVQILIAQAGILNLECQDIRISKSTNEYIQGHIEDLNALGDLLYEELIQKVFQQLLLKHVSHLEMEETEPEHNELAETEDKRNHIHPTKRFIRKKEEMENLQKSQLNTSRASSTETVPSDVQLEDDFDYQVHGYDPEEYSYKHVSLAGTVSLAVKPEKPFYNPLTDVLYPGEKDSTYDLKKFLRGDYCLESDLLSTRHKKVIGPHISYVSEMYKFDDESDIVSMESLASDDEQEIRRYIKLNVDRVSFAGSVIRSIARGVGKYNIFEDARKSELITDEELRRFRVASMDRRSRDVQDKKVSISLPSGKKEPNKIQRRQTGFLRPEDLEKIYLINKASSQNLEDDDESMTGYRKVQIAESFITTQTSMRPVRRPTGSIQAAVTESDTQVRRQSALSRLYDNMTECEQEGPTLRDYKPSSQTERKHFILTQSPVSRIKHEEPSEENFFRQSITIEDSSIEKVLNFQHSKKFARKISSDYVKTIDQIEHKPESSIRSVEFARKRPSMSVSEYQQKNLKYLEEVKKVKTSSSTKFTVTKHSLHGLRLPGDTPLYSMADVDDYDKTR